MKNLFFCLVISIFIVSNICFPQYRTINETNIGNIADYTISPDSKTLVYLTYQNLKFYDIEKNKLSKTISVNENSENKCLSYTPDGKNVLWKYNDDKIYCYNIEKNSLELKDIHCGTFKVSPIGNLLFMYLWEGGYPCFKLIDFNTKTVLKKLDASNNGYYDISSDGSKILCGKGTWGSDINICTLLPEINCNSYSFQYMDFADMRYSNTSKYVVINKEKAYIWKLEDNTTKVFNFKGTFGQNNICYFSPIDDIFVTTNQLNGSKIEVYSTDGNKLGSYDIKNMVYKILFSPNGKYLIFDFRGYGVTEIRIFETLKISSLLKLYNKYYESNYKDYQSELNKVFDKSKSKDEFETYDEYINRLVEASLLKNAIDETYYSLIQSLMKGDIDKQTSEIDSKNKEIQEKINNSVQPAETKISFVGTYDINTELLPVTINGVTDNVKIKRDEAKSLKENFSSAVVRGKKRLKYDLNNYEFFDLIIIHPITKEEYKVGNW